MSRLLICISRNLFSWVFIVSGVEKLMSWNASVDMLSVKIFHWYLYLETIPVSRVIYDVLSPYTSFLMGGAVCLKIIGGLSLFFGVKVRLGSILLLFFLIPSTILFHAFWFPDEGNQYLMLLSFLKNLSLIGALLMFVAIPKVCKIEL